MCGAGLTGAQPSLLPESSLGPFDDRLRAIEKELWADPWGARAALEGMQSESQLKSGSGDGSTAYHMLLAQSLLYLHVDEALSGAVDAGLNSLTAQTPTRMRRALNLLQGMRLNRDGDYERSIEQLNAVRDAARSEGLETLAVLATAELGYANTQAGRHEDALTWLQLAYEDAFALKDPFPIAVVNEVFGLLYTYLDQPGNAIRFYQTALADYETLGYPVSVAEAVFGIGIAHRYAGQWELALQAFQRYQNLTEMHADVHSRFTAAYGLGTTLADMGDCEGALPIIDSALAIQGPQGYTAELLKRAASCHARAGNGMVAYEILERYHNATLDLVERNASQRRFAQRETLENERQALQIELLQEQARVRTLEIARQQGDIRAQRISVALLVAALTLATILAWWRLRDMRRLRALSTQDSLTGVSNRRFIFKRLESLLAGLDSERGDVAVLLLDIDDFKAINDRFGHPIGDVVLQSLAEALRDVLRPGDELARIGGEEFMLVLPRTDSRSAMAVAWRLHECIQDMPIKGGGGKSLAITVSIGVACTRGRARSTDALYGAADEALYRAKAGGKNRCELASPRDPSSTVPSPDSED